MSAQKSQRSVEDEAVQWWSRMRFGRFGASDSAAFEQWRNAHPDHAAAFERAERTWRELGEISAIPEASELLQETARAVRDERMPPRRNHAKAIAAGVAAIALLALIPLGRDFLQDRSYTTRTGELRTVSLPDGSQVTLGPRSRVELAFTDRERHVRLAGGEAFFDVRRDAKRPFAVDAGDTLVQVVGTRFNVRRGAENVSVAVLEGTVEVFSEPATPGAASPFSSRHVVRAGQQIVAGKSAPEVAARSIQSTAPPDSWRTGRLAYDGMPLVEVLADINRYYAPGITLGTVGLEQLRVTTSFRTDQVDRMINSLTVALPLKAERGPDGRIVLYATTGESP